MDPIAGEVLVLNNVVFQFMKPSARDSKALTNFVSLGLQGCLLFVNGVAVLNNERFLEKCE